MTSLAASTPRDIRLLRYEEHGKLGIGVQLYRAGSGEYLVRKPNSDWLDQMALVAALNYGEVSIVLTPTARPGYQDKHGCSLTIVPGTLAGKRGNTQSLRSPIRQKDLIDFPGRNPGCFELEMGLSDAIRLHTALGEVIENAKKLSRK